MLLQIRRGSSYTIGIRFDASYDTTTLVSVAIESSYTELNNFPLTTVGSAYQMRLSSAFTSAMPLNSNFSIVMNDSLRGIKKSQVFTVNVIGEDLGGTSTFSTILDADIIISPIMPTVEVIERVLATIKGEKGDSVTGITLSGNNLVFAVENRANTIVAVSSLQVASDAAISAEADALIATQKALEAVNANLAAQQARTDALAAAQQASNVALQQNFGRNTSTPTISLDSFSRHIPSYLPCTRAGVATFFDQSGVLRTANANEGRIDFDPVTGECLGLLDEDVATNFIVNSTVIANSSVVNGTSTVTTTKNTYGDFLYELKNTIGNNQWTRYRQNTGLNAGTYRASVVVSVVDSVVGVQLGNSILGARFNFATMTTTQYGTGTANAVIIPLRNGDFLIETNFTINTSGSFSEVSTVSVWRVTNTGSNNSNLNDAILVSSYQISNITTRYIRTTGATVTRPADLFATTGFQFARRYNQREGTFYINTRAISNLNNVVATFTDGSANNNRITLYANGTLETSKFVAGTSSIVTKSANVTGATVGTNSIFGFTYRYTTDGRFVTFKVCRNGGTIAQFQVSTEVQDLGGGFFLDLNEMPAPDRFQLGTGIYVKNMRYIPRALSDTRLQFVTNPLYFVGIEEDKVPTVGDFATGAWMNLEDIYAANPEIQTYFGIGSTQTIVINRPYPFTLQQVYLSPTGVTSSSLPTLPTTGFYAANTDYNIVLNATNTAQLTVSITRIRPL